MSVDLLLVAPALAAVLAVGGLPRATAGLAWVQTAMAAMLIVGGAEPVVWSGLNGSPWSWSPTIPGLVVVALAALARTGAEGDGDPMPRHAARLGWLAATMVALAVDARVILGGLALFATCSTLTHGGRSRRGASAAGAGTTLAVFAFGALAVTWSVAFHDASRGLWSTTPHELEGVVLTVGQQELAVVTLLGLGGLLTLMPVALWRPISASSAASDPAPDPAPSRANPWETSIAGALGLLLVQTWWLPMGPVALAEWAEPVTWLGLGGASVAAIAGSRERDALPARAWCDAAAGSIALVGVLSQTAEGMVGAWAWIIGRGLAGAIRTTTEDARRGASLVASIGRAARASIPGTLPFVGVVAVGVGVMHSVAVFEHRGLVAAAVAGVAVLIARSEWADSTERAGEPVGLGHTAYAAVLAVLVVVGGLFPERVLGPVIDDAVLRADEQMLRRCAHVELREIPRARLRSEMKVVCEDPAQRVAAEYGARVLAAPTTEVFE